MVGPPISADFLLLLRVFSTQLCQKLSIFYHVLYITVYLVDILPVFVSNLHVILGFPYSVNIHKNNFIKSKSKFLTKVPQRFLFLFCLFVFFIIRETSPKGWHLIVQCYKMSAQNKEKRAEQ